MDTGLRFTFSFYFYAKNGDYKDFSPSKIGDFA